LTSWAEGNDLREDAKQVTRESPNFFLEILSLKPDGFSSKDKERELVFAVLLDTKEIINHNSTEYYTMLSPQQLYGAFRLLESFGEKGILENFQGKGGLQMMAHENSGGMHINFDSKSSLFKIYRIFKNRYWRAISILLIPRNCFLQL
jgi:hypothetical protein